MREMSQWQLLPRAASAHLTGMMVVVIFSTASDAALHAIGVLPPLGQPMADSLLLLATAYRSVYAVAGSYLAARLAPDRHMQHALALGGVGLVASTLGAAATWNGGTAFEPKWYPLALTATAMPPAWIGGSLYRMRP